MTTQLISPDAIAIVLEDREIADSGCAKLIIKELLLKEGIAPWADMEVELFQNGSATLLMARRVFRCIEGYAFRDFELLLSAACRCHSSLPSQLFWFSGKYWLLIGAYDEQDSVVLSEFSCEICRSDNYLLHIKEQGKCIAAHSAIEKLQKVFI